MNTLSNVWLNSGVTAKNDVSKKRPSKTKTSGYSFGRCDSEPENINKFRLAAASFYLHRFSGLRRRQLRNLQKASTACGSQVARRRKP
jgi:hypothetical protein